jgi:poly(A) polymerase
MNGADLVLPPPVVAVVEPLAARFVSAGHELHLVGGIVRDLIMHGPGAFTGDLDCTTDARPEQTRRLVAPLADAVWTQGERFGTIGARIGDCSVEITTYRAEAYEPDSRKPTVVFADALDADLSRRDFTINAMALRLPDRVLTDPFGGLDDLRGRRLRTPLDPEVSFTDDPLRMLRAARFVARFGLRCDPAVAEAMRRYASRLAIVSAERIREELHKLLTTPDPVPGLRLVLDTGVLGVVLPEVADAPDTERERVLAAVGVLGDPTLRWAALLHGLDRRVLEHRLDALRTSVAERRLLVGLAAAIGRLGAAAAMGGLAPEDARELAADLGDHRAAALALVRALAIADTVTVEAAWSALVADGDDLADFAPALSGEEVMALLGLGPGRAVGAALAALRQARRREGVRDPQAARAWLQRWWADQGPPA